MIKVLIADDHPVVRQGLKTVLKKHLGIAVVAEAKDAQEAVELARTLEWDVAVIDYSMPGRSGADLVDRLKREQPSRPVLVLSMHAEDLHAIQVLKAGASGYLNKDSAADELVQAIMKVARGGKYVSRALAEKLAEELSENSDQARRLSDREYRVMRLLAQGKPLSEISKELCLSPSTISTYRARIFRKLRLSNNADLVRYAMTKESKL